MTSQVAQTVNHVYNAGDLGSILGSGRPPGEGNGNPLQYSCLENPMDLVGYSPWGRKESDMTERLHYYYFFPQVHRIPTSSFNVTLIVNMGQVRGSKYYASQSVLVVKSFLKKICLSSRHLSSISHTFL